MISCGMISIGTRACDMISVGVIACDMRSVDVIPCDVASVGVLLGWVLPGGVPFTRSNVKSEVLPLVRDLHVLPVGYCACDVVLYARMVAGV